MNNEYCILLSKLLLPLLHKPKDLIYRAGYSLPMKLNFNQFPNISTQRREKQPRCSTLNVKKFIVCVFLKKKDTHVKLFAFHFLDMQHKHGPLHKTPRGGFSHWGHSCLCFYDPWPINNVSPAASHHVGSLYFHPTLHSDVSTLKCNWVVKQSLKQPPCNHWLFYFAPWFRYRAIKALPSAHPLVL